MLWRFSTRGAADGHDLLSLDTTSIGQTCRGVLLASNHWPIGKITGEDTEMATSCANASMGVGWFRGKISYANSH
jgi:hypothetical protein